MTSPQTSSSWGSFTSKVPSILNTSLLLLAIFTFSYYMAGAQCYPDRHNTTWYDGWISCTASDNPDSSNGVSHWIMYNFNKETAIHHIHVWNSNVPGKLDYGIKEARIQYSQDGSQWQELNTFTFEKATGLNTYEGFDLPAFESFKAQYVLITALNNYGGECYGLSEIRFSVDSSLTALPEAKETGSKLNASLYPNPFYSKTTVKITTVSDKKLTWYVTDTHGKRIISKTAIQHPDNNSFSIKGYHWQDGVYFLILRQGNKKREFKLVKLSK